MPVELGVDQVRAAIAEHMLLPDTAGFARGNGGVDKPVVAIRLPEPVRTGLGEIGEAVDLIGRALALAA